MAEIKRVLEMRLERLIKRLSAGLTLAQLKNLEGSFKDTANDRVIEDWALRAAPENLEEVLDFISQKYSRNVYRSNSSAEQLEFERSKYRMSLLVELLGVTEDREQIVRIKTEIGNYPKKLKMEPEQLTKDILRTERAMRHPEVLLRASDKFEGAKLNNNQKIECLTRMLRTDYQKAKEGLMAILDEEKLGDDNLKKIYSDVARFSPQDALIMFEYHDSNERSQGIAYIVAATPEKKRKDFLLWVDARGRPKITNDVIDIMLRFDETEVIAVLEEFSGSARESVFARLSPNYGPEVLWQMLAQKNETVKNALAAYVKRQYIDNMNQASWRKSYVSASDMDIRAVLDDPRLSELQERFSMQGYIGSRHANVIHRCLNRVSSTEGDAADAYTKILNFFEDERIDGIIEKFGHKVFAQAAEVATLADSGRRNFFEFFARPEMSKFLETAGAAAAESALTVTEFRMIHDRQTQERFLRIAGSDRLAHVLELFPGERQILLGKFVGTLNINKPVDNVFNV